MKKINTVLDNHQESTENKSNISRFSTTSTEIPNELIAMAKRNPFRESNDNQEKAGDNIKAASILVAMLKAALVASITLAKGSPSSSRAKN